MPTVPGGWCVVFWGTRVRNGLHAKRFPTYVQHFDWKANAQENAAERQAAARRAFPDTYAPFFARYPDAQVWDVMTEETFAVWDKLARYGARRLRRIGTPRWNP